MDSRSLPSFLSNHFHLLLCLFEEPDVRLKDASAKVGVSERAITSILADLERNGLITRSRRGRRNHYELHLDARLPGPKESCWRVRDLLVLSARRRSPEAAPMAEQPQVASELNTPAMETMHNGHGVLQ